MTGQQLTPATAKQRLADTSASTPLRVSVTGLPGVGSSTVAAALTALGRYDVTVDTKPDVSVRVVAEALKLEDFQAVAATEGQVLVLLNKADTCGLGAGGPVETARRRCAGLAARAGVPAEPVVGLLARAALDMTVLDAELLDAVRVLAGEPADLRTAEAFVTAPHSLTFEIRHRLLATLDLFGIAHAVVVVRGRPAATADDVRAALRRVSGIDSVATRISALGAESRYRRLQSVVAELEVAAAVDATLADVLDGDDVLLARMTVALEVMRTAGLATDSVSEATAAAHLDRARRWRGYGAGPVSLTHQACAADIVRGSVRLWSVSR